MLGMRETCIISTVAAVCDRRQWVFSTLPAVIGAVKKIKARIIYRVGT